MRYTQILPLAAVLFLLIQSAPVAMAQDAGPTPEEIAEREKMLTSLVGHALIGKFTIDNQPNDKPDAPERYEFLEVRRISGKMWYMRVRIKYGKIDQRVPIAVPVEWAGKTPVITLENFEIPRMGIFSGRVLFHGKRYVGTWQHGEVGGHMFGRIEKIKKKKSAGPKESATAPPAAKTP